MLIVAIVYARCIMSMFSLSIILIRSWWNAFTDSLPSLCPGVPAGAGLPDIHWLPPLCPLEILPHPSAKETKVYNDLYNIDHVCMHIIICAHAINTAKYLLKSMTTIWIVNLSSQKPSLLHDFSPFFRGVWFLNYSITEWLRQCMIMI